MGMTSSPTLHRRERDWSLSHGAWIRSAVDGTQAYIYSKLFRKGQGALICACQVTCIQCGLPSVDLDLARFDHRRPAFHLGVHMRPEFRR
jgi:hypothetical protein